MGQEIERKFLWNYDYDVYGIVYNCPHELIADYYITANCRMRFKENRHCTLTIKSEGTISRQEDEYNFILMDPKLPDKLLKKERYHVQYNGQLFEVNIFQNVFMHGKHLIMVEIELENENQEIDLPPWIDEEVTNNLKYYGYNLYKI